MGGAVESVGITIDQNRFAPVFVFINLLQISTIKGEQGATAIVSSGDEQLLKFKHHIGI